MAKLVVTRSSEWMNMGRSLRLYMDGQKLGTISNGDTKQFDLADGTHVFKAKIDWCGCREYTFTVTGNEIKEVTVSSFGYYIHFVTIFSGLLSLHFLLNWLFDFYYLVWIIAIYLPTLCYYFTFGRNRFLLVREQHR